MKKKIQGIHSSTALAKGAAATTAAAAALRRRLPGPDIDDDDPQAAAQEASVCGAWRGVTVHDSHMTVRDPHVTVCDPHMTGHPKLFRFVIVQCDFLVLVIPIGLFYALGSVHQS